MSSVDDGALTSAVIAHLAHEGLTVAAAESLTGGGVTAELTSVPGASAVVLGGAVVYATALKHTLLGVDASLLAEFGPVHPEVAVQMADGVRRRLAVDGRAADIGVSTTGVAGPEPQGGKPVGTVYVGLARAESTRVVELSLTGSRESIRRQVVLSVVRELARELGMDAA